MKVLLALVIAVASGVSARSCRPRIASRSLWTLRGGSTASFDEQCDKALRSAVQQAQAAVETFDEEIESGSCVADFGAKAQTIYEEAVGSFAAAVGDEAGSKIGEVEKAIDAPLRVLYMKQLLLLREKALKRYKASSRSSESSDFEAMTGADTFFSKEAESSTRPGSDWDFSAERASLQATMHEIAQCKKKLQDTRLQAAKNQQEAFQTIQYYQSQIQQLQQAAYGTASPWNMALAYRVPDTNINLSAGHQSGRTNIQLSCVPDESAALLGPNGFTRGVGPGNLGVSVNLSL